MLTHPDLMLELVHEHQRELIAEADQGRLLALVRRAARRCRTSAVRGQPAGTLAACEGSPAAPAR